MANREYYRPANTVLATLVEDPNVTHTFMSFAEAGRYLIEHNLGVGHNQRQCVARAARDNRQYLGYTWTIVDNTTPPQQLPIAPVIEDNTEAVSDNTNVMNIVLGHARPNLNARITNNPPRKISVYDLIQGITGAVNPHQVWHNITTQHPDILQNMENHTFPGTGQRPTPVTTAEGAVIIMNLLPGPVAAAFRMECAHIIVGVLGGSADVAAMIQRNADIQATLPNDHPMRIFAEAVQTDTNVSSVTVLDSTATIYEFLSPSMQGKYLDEFIDKNVVYLVMFEYNNITYIKFGISEKGLDRMKAHIKKYPNAKLYCMHEANHFTPVENSFKTTMECRGKLISAMINGVKSTELVANISPMEAEELLVSIVNKIEMGDYTRIRLEEIALKRLQLEMEARKSETKIRMLTMLLERQCAMNDIKELMAMAFDN